ncbi:hypothetical protein [Flavobacterium tyrosinilyticum]|uniref:hypothetical protein n=1 Tax=Flavobacterium tyrosinilyticum TaxID=1658740 RepID=UPI00202E4E4F|nr:hypothetical protein [Flavobacterium tyrosinilyticum]MCM0666401.1 hypothetical protein [Flavobacterium tyrosinilyticum]
MAKNNAEIQTHFEKYEKLLGGEKNCEKKIIVLDEIKNNHSDTRLKSAKVEHPTIKMDMELLIESKVHDKRSFKFKLRAKDLTVEPFFRFDSDGVSHLNKIPLTPLNELKIDTPHFHKFDNEGRNIAYQTDSLKNPTTREILLNDVSLCMAHYCDESKTYYNSEYIEIKQTPTSELDLDTDSFNPLNGVDYE